MKRINFGRVILGGLVAGVLINISEFVLNTIVLKSEMEAGMKALGKTVPQSGGTIGVWTILGFAMGIASVWLYAAIRPRYGPGAGTALRAALALWALANVTFSVAVASLGIFPVRLTVIATAWSLVEVIVAVLVGASLYREDDSRVS